MNIERFEREYSTYLFSSTDDDIFSALKVTCDGLSSAKTAKLLNLAVRCLENKEIYFEIGTYTGYTMVSAGYRTMKLICGCDTFKPDFGPNDDPNLQDKLYNTFKSNIADYIANVQFYKNDFRNVVLDEKIGCLFVDGKHNHKEVMDAFKWSKDYLTDKALIFLDDLRINGVHNAIFDWLEKNKEYKMLFYARANLVEEQGKLIDPYLANGFAIIERIKERNTNG